MRGQVTIRINTHRLPNPFQRPNIDTRDEYPVIILSVEGNVTEYKYFERLENAINSRNYRYSNVVFHVLPLPRLDTKSDPDHVIALLKEYEDANPIRCEDAILAIVIDLDHKPAEEIERIIGLCKNRQYEYQFFLSNPCFEFFLLLHLCDDIEQECDLMLIKNNPRINGNTYIGRLLSDLTHAKKDVPFDRIYLDNIDKAMINSQRFEMNINRLVVDIGTNLCLLFEMISGVRTTMWSL